VLRTAWIVATSLPSASWQKNTLSGLKPLPRMRGMASTLIRAPSGASPRAASLASTVSFNDVSGSSRWSRSWKPIRFQRPRENRLSDRSSASISSRSSSSMNTR